jgi:GT2 family glycosyltransferase
VRERYPRARLLENGGNLGFGRAINRALRVAAGDYLVFLNNDLYLEPDSIGKLAQTLESDPRIGAAVPKILYYEKRDTINSLGVLIHYTGIAYPNLIDTRDGGGVQLLETACGGIFMFKREVYDAVGGFDEDLFLYHEDHDLSWRIRLMGWRLVVNPAAAIYHHYHFHKGAFKYYSSEKNRLYLLAKNLELKTLFLIIPALLVIEAAQLAHGLLNGWFTAKIKSYIELLALLPRILEKRRQLQSARRVADREIVRLYQGRLRVSGLQNPLLDKILSPALDCYWRLIRRWI